MNADLERESGRGYHRVMDLAHVGTKSRTLCLAVVGLTLLTSLASAEAVRFTFVDLGKATGIASSSAVAINQDGAVLVSDISRNGNRTFIWRPGKPKPETGAVTEIQLPEPRSCEALAMNDYGQVLFVRRGKEPADKGLVLWTPSERGGTKGELTAIRFDTDGQPTEGLLGADGSVVTKVWKKVRPVAVRWLPDQPNGKTGRVMTVEDQKTKVPMAWPTAIGANGWIVGHSAGDANGCNLWRPDAGQREHGTLHRVAPPGDPSTSLFHIDTMTSKNVIAGRWGGDGGLSGAVVFALGDDFKPGPARETRVPVVFAIDDAGNMVGPYSGEGSFYHSQGSETYDLARLVDNLPAGWRDVSTMLMNGRGWIAASAWDGQGPAESLRTLHALVLIPATASRP